MSSLEYSQLLGKKMVGCSDVLWITSLSDIICNRLLKSRASSKVAEIISNFLSAKWEEKKSDSCVPFLLTDFYVITLQNRIISADTIMRLDQAVGVMKVKLLGLPAIQLYCEFFSVTLILGEIVIFYALNTSLYLFRIWKKRLF